ncbi:MAG: tetratricopeptide repeat protein [Alphaproteobacteria bacterium]
MLRKLTAIMSIDVAGYSRMMEQDEAGTLERLKTNRREVFDPRIAASGGRVFKLMGDGALAEFPSVVAAVECALDIQSTNENREASAPEAKRIRYRIGVNLGDVMVDGEDIYGDGVNVAARLQALAEPGGIAVSRAVRDHVAGKLPADFQDLGEHSVKNIERPIHVFAVRSKSEFARGHREDQEPHVAICVLPFANLSGDPEQEYFSDGVTEDIITDLSKVSSLSIVSRSTAFSFKNKPVDLAHLARQLRVTHILEGSVRKAGERVRVTAQLIDGATDSHVWAERYDRDLKDIFALQDEISEAIVATLKLKLLPSEKKAIESRSTTNPEAYKLYLMARQYNLTANARHREIIIRLCRRAVEIDPNYARAWALLAVSQANLVLLGGVPGDRGWDAAQKALSLEPDLAEAHAARGRILADEGNFDDAVREHQTALRLDPDSYDVNVAAARCFIPMRRFQEAIHCLEKAIAVAESDFWAAGMVTQCYRAIGDREHELAAARRTLSRVEKVIATEPDHGSAMSFGVNALASLGEAERAKEWASRAILLDPDNANLRYNLGCALVQLGDFDAALDFLEPVFQGATQQGLEWMIRDSDLDPLRDHPRYAAIIAATQARLGAASVKPH